jgi:drug/metabolite transporter (DMT)-like permease
MLTKAAIEKYFLAEKQESLFFLIIGIAAILLAVVFFFSWKTNFAKGATFPLLLIGLIEAAAGYVVYVRSDDQRINNVYSYDMNPGKLKNEELPRMKTVNRNFLIYRWGEIFFVVAGLVLIFLYKNNSGKTFLLGLGITLAIQAALLFGADFIAAKRAAIYTEQLENFANNK